MAALALSSITSLSQLNENIAFIALCPNLHRAFDRGLISISDDYTVLVSPNFAEDTRSVFALSQFDGQRIKLPYKESLFPDRRRLAAHREKWGFAG